jgi:hypothetical protein
VKTSWRHAAVERWRNRRRFSNLGFGGDLRSRRKVVEGLRPSGNYLVTFYALNFSELRLAFTFWLAAIFRCAKRCDRGRIDESVSERAEVVRSE